MNWPKCSCVRSGGPFRGGSRVRRPGRRQRSSAQGSAHRAQEQRQGGRMPTAARRTTKWLVCKAARGMLVVEALGPIQYIWWENRAQTQLSLDDVTFASLRSRVLAAAGRHRARRGCRLLGRHTAPVDAGAGRLRLPARPRAACSWTRCSFLDTRGGRKVLCLQKYIVVFTNFDTRTLVVTGPTPRGQWSGGSASEAAERGSAPAEAS